MAMKKIAVAAVVLALGTAIAIAADMPVKAPVAAMPVPYSWTGFYVGLNAGYSWGSSSTTQSFRDTTSGAILSLSHTRFDMDGAIGGGQAGYNWQQQNWVFGVEADIQTSGQKGNGSAVCAGGTLAAAPFNGACTAGHIGDTAPF